MVESSWDGSGDELKAVREREGGERGLGIGVGERERDIKL